MSSQTNRGMSLSAILLMALLLLLAGAALSAWALARNPDAARFLGVGRPAPMALASAQPVPAAVPIPVPALAAPSPDAAARVVALEARLARVENATARAEGSAGRADALLVAFAARRAIDRGVSLGYLEPLLAERFGPTHPQAVATIVTAARQPVRLDQLNAEFALLAPRLKAAPPGTGLWQNIRRELGGLVAIRRADQPSQRAVPTYDRAAARLNAGQVDQALAEAMRLPGIEAAPAFVAGARRHIAAHRALDQLEGAALLAR